MSNSNEVPVAALQNQVIDYVASAAKSILGAVPFAGSLLVELAGVIIPNQRMDRLAKFAATLDDRLKAFDEQFVRSKLRDENFTDIFEESLRQAARSLSDERRSYIATLLASGLSSNAIELAETKHLLKILGEINDIEVIWLRYYLVESQGGDGVFRQKHAGILQGVLSNARASLEVRDKAALQTSYKEHLVQLGLLARRYETEMDRLVPVLDRITGGPSVQGYQITGLGRLLLRYIGLTTDEAI